MKLRLLSWPLGVMLGTFVGLLAFTPSALGAVTVTFGTPQPVGGFYLESIACETANTCLAVGNTDEVIPINNGVPGTPLAVPAPANATSGYSLKLTDVVCASSSTCYAVGNYLIGSGGPSGGSGGAVVMIVNGVPSQAQIITANAPEGFGPTNELALTGISCWDSSGCEAIGNLTMSEGQNGAPSSDGVAASLLNGVPQSVNASTVNLANLGIYVFDSIECFGQGTCDILGTDDNDNGFLVGINGSTFAPTQADAGLVDSAGTFACYSTSSCLILSGFGDFYQTLTDNTTLGPDVTGLKTSSYSGSCPTATVCWIVGGTVQGQTVAEPIVSGVAQATTTTSNVGQLVGVACASATSCLAITRSAVISFTETTSTASDTGPSGSDSGSSSSPGAGSGSSSGDGSGSGSSNGPGTSSSNGSSASPQVTVAKPRQKDGVTEVAVECKNAKCSVKLTETIKVKQGKKTKLQTVASKAVTLAAGKSAVESLKLNALGAKSLKKANGKRLKTTLTITLDGKRVSVKTLTLTIGKTKKA